MLKYSPYNTHITTIVDSFFVDDVLWFCMAYLEVYRLSGKTEHLTAAENIFEFIVSHGCIPNKHGTPCNLVWNSNVCKDHKNCSTTASTTQTSNNVWGVVPAIKLYNLTKNSKYLTYATAWIDRLNGDQDFVEGKGVYTYTHFLAIYTNLMLPLKENDPDRSTTKYTQEAVKLWGQLSEMSPTKDVLYDKVETDTDSRQFKTIAMLLFADLPTPAKVFPKDFASAQLSAIQSNRSRKLCSYPDNNILQGANESYFTNSWANHTKFAGCQDPLSIVDIATQCGGLSVLNAVVNAGG